MIDLTAITCVAIPLLIVSGPIILNNILFTLRSEKTTGIVTGYESKRSSKNGTTHAETVEFQAPDGKTIQFTEKLYRTVFIISTGRTVNVLYNPEDPTQARINSFITLYSIPTILLVISLGVIFFSLPMFSGLLKTILDFITNLINKLPWWL